MTRIALLADPHLSDVEHTPQEEALDWALEEVSNLAPDACVWLGDITACGSPEAAIRFRKKIDRLPCPSVTVVGNSDIRNAATALTMEGFLSNYSRGLKLNDLRIIGINTSHDRLSQAERERLAHLEIGEDVVLCSHQPPTCLDAESSAFMEAWIGALKRNGRRVLAWACGHIHIYREAEFAGVPVYSLCALDLDKNRGDVHVCLLTVDNGKATLVEKSLYTRGTLASWSEEEKREFSQLLGFTCYNRSKVERDLPFAIANRVRHLELRSVTKEDYAALDQWRQVGGQTLSLHLSSLNFRDNAIGGEEKFRSDCADALAAGVDLITVHPPQPPIGIMLDSDLFNELADRTADALLPLAQEGIDILVENNHTPTGTTADPLLRGYGCTPMEMIGWRDALRERLGKDSCHLRFDIGHARNNMPVSKDYPIGKWMALIGADCRSYHLHQTEMDKVTKKMKNHHPITELHGGLVSFDGFLWAWKSGLLHHGPIILEIREGEGVCPTWTRLQEMLK